ncbi:MAG: hypothetical protein KKG99_07300 [Bacteroidetes bacterium]|nr:hypothetical protein [Bacteroidota bacterium]
MKKFSTNLGIISILIFLSVSFSNYSQKLTLHGKHLNHATNVEEIGYNQGVVDYSARNLASEAEFETLLNLIF